MKLRLALLLALSLLLGALAAACTATTRPVGFDTGPRPMDAGTDAGPPETCDDGILNQDEGDVDCGGVCDTRCMDMASCNANDDCISGVCLAGTCRAPSCMDGVRNGDETGTDCGPTCGTCAGGEPCMDHAECTSGVCRFGICTDPSCSDEVQNGDESDIDCGGVDCPGCLGDEMCRDDSDCRDNFCLEGLCVPPTCDDGLRNQDETDIDCGGSICPGCGSDLACLTNMDCAERQCYMGTCVSCRDGSQNGAETDVDCGGGGCSGCATGRMCVANTDCTSNICDAATGLCNAPGCGDGIQNGAETDLDCGGGSCLGCADGLTCALPRDCLSGICNAGVCAPPGCTDGIRNGGETDVDCGGPTTCPRCADRLLCSVDTDCTAGVCSIPPGRCGTFSGCHWALISQETQLDDVTIQDLLTLNGHTFDVHNNNTSGAITSDAALLGTYTHIIMQKHDRTLTTAESTALTNWVNAGGRLIVTGYDSLGSPTDSLLATLLRCSGPADGPFSSSLSVVDATHPIMMGPAQAFTMGMSLTASSTDHDSCTPVMGATRLVSVSGTSSKVQIAEGIGGTGGMVVYWNANGSSLGPLTEWTGAGGTQPDLQNLFVNLLNHLCTGP